MRATSLATTHAPSEFVYGSTTAHLPFIRPTDVEPSAQVSQVTPNVPPFEPGIYDGEMRVDVRCTVERAHQPGRRIESDALRKSTWTVDPLLEERGIPRLFWEPVSRDPFLETKIAYRIAELASPSVRARELGGEITE